MRQLQRAATQPTNANAKLLKRHINKVAAREKSEVVVKYLAPNEASEYIRNKINNKTKKSSNNNIIRINNNTHTNISDHNNSADFLCSYFYSNIRLLHRLARAKIHAK